MAAAIGEPDVDPHGAPIPTRDGAVDERRLVSLAELALGKRARVLRVSDEDPGMLRYLAELDIVPGAELIVEGREPFGGPIACRLGKTLRSVGPELAAHVRVEEIVAAPSAAEGGQVLKKKAAARGARRE
jgi:DtxR family Mn-dependent transcriptional regulator